MLDNRTHVVVTGAFGFVGRHVSRSLSRAGYRVTGIGRGHWPFQDALKWGLSAWHETDLTSDVLRRCANQPFAIVHCAGSGSVRLSISEPFADFTETVSTTMTVLEYIRTSSPSTKLVYPSSASVYGNATTYPTAESSNCQPISPYGVHKLVAEQLIKSYCTQYDLSASTVRFFSIYGAGLTKQLLWDACSKLSSNDSCFMGTGDEVRDWIHVEDAAEVLLLALSKASPACPVVNGATGEGVSIQDVLHTLCRALGVGGETPSFSGQSACGDPTRYIADISRLRAWGWKPRKSLNDGIREYVAWWSSEWATQNQHQAAAVFAT